MADAAIHGHDHEHKGFFTRWFMSTNHKDIGILYLFTGGLVGLISVIFTLYMRMELMHPGVQYMCQEGARFIATADTCTPNGHLWNVMITYHGVLMMFFVVIPALFGGFGNYFMPLQIGAPDMAFPRMNNLSYWMFVAGVSLGVASMLSPGGNGDLTSGLGSGSGVAQGAAVRLVDLCDRMAGTAGAAGSRWRDHHAADRPELWHHLLHAFGRR